MIAGLIRESGLDSDARRQPMSGGGFLKGDIHSSIPFTIEVKNQKRVSILDWIDQSKRQAEQANIHKSKWCTVFLDPRTTESRPEIYAVLAFNELLILLLNEKKSDMVEGDNVGREMKQKAYRAKLACHDLYKELEKLF